MISRITDEMIHKKSFDLLDSWAVPIPLNTLAMLFGLDTDKSYIQKLHQHAIAINKAIFVTGGTGPRRKNRPNAIEKATISWAILKNIPKLIKLRRLVGKTGMKELKKMIQTARKDIEVPRPSFEHIPAGIGPIFELMITFLEKLNEAKLEAPVFQQNSTLHIFNEFIKNENATLIEMMMAGVFILFAGHETTTSLLSNCFVHLAKHPIAYQELKEHPEKIDNFIEEVLRYYTPVGRFLRRTNEAVTRNGQIIPKDSILILMPGAANTDPQKFKNACLFDLNRKNARQHLSFGKGAHFCIGAPLARLMVKLALVELLKKTKSIKIDESKPASMVTDRDSGVYRYEKLNVIIE